MFSTLAPALGALLWFGPAFGLFGLLIYLVGRFAKWGKVEAVGSFFIVVSVMGWLGRWFAPFEFQRQSAAAFADVSGFPGKPSWLKPPPEGLRAILGDRLKEEVRTPDELRIVIRNRVPLTDGGHLLLAGAEARTIGAWLSEAPARMPAKSVTMSFDAKGQDAYGNPADLPLVTLRWLVDDLRKVNWSSIDADLLLNLARFDRVEPAGERLVRSWCASNDHRWRVCRSM